jgi:SAM-dependent methyltransferase
MIMAVVGDRLNLFKELSKSGPVTAEEFAKKVKLDERYVIEWMRGMYAADYLVYDPSSDTYHLPSNYQPILADEEGPMFLGGVIQQLSSMWKVLEPVMNSFRNGSGVDQSEYDELFWSSIERETVVGFKHSLVPEWIESMPDVKAKLERGIRVADLGCGNGRALMVLAKTFPNSTFVGYDNWTLSIEKARFNAEEEGITGNLSFEVVDITKGLPQTFDLLTAFDVLHDMIDPQEALHQISKSLDPEGIFLLLDFSASDKPEENKGPFSTILYGFSLMYCMTTSMANDGLALGTAGLTMSKLREFCFNADMYNIEELPVSDEFNTLYRIEF